MAWTVILSEHPTTKRKHKRGRDEPSKKVHEEKYL